MYALSHINKKFKKNKVDGYLLDNLDGFIMTSKHKFIINNQVIKDIKIVDKKMANKLVAKKVSKYFNKLINILTELLTSDDETGDDLREALNQIEKFRLEIKNKYRLFLNKKELENMSKKLLALKKEAFNRLNEINEYTNKFKNDKSR